MPQKNRPVNEDDTIRALLLLMPRLVGRAKRIPVPTQLQGFNLAPRHLSLLALLLFDDALTINELARRLELAPTTVSLIVADLSRKGLLERREAEQDRRRRIIAISDSYRTAVTDWLSRGANAWRVALAGMSGYERALLVDTLHRYEAAFDEVDDRRST